MNTHGRMRGALPPRKNYKGPHYGAMRAEMGATIPPVPLVLDWLKGIDRNALGTLGNAPDPAEPNGLLVGDCGIVGMYRFIQCEQFLSGQIMAGGEALYPCAIQAYSEISGYVQGDQTTDTGVNLQDALTYWMKTGIPLPNGSRHKIVAFFRGDYTNDAELREIVAVCGGAYVGQDIPDAYDSSVAGDTWDVAGPGTGGHCTDIMAYSPGIWDMESWAMRFPETAAAKNTYMTEAWAVISPTWAKATGQTPFNITLDQAEAAMAGLA